MSRARTWSIRLSVDDLNASICLLESDEEIAAWARGLLRGLNAGECKDGASSAYREGWEIGRPARERADEIRLSCAETGRVGGNKRVANAQADAQAFASPDASPIAQPVAQPERRTNNVELRTKEQKPRRARQAAFDPSEFDALIPVEWAISGAFVSAWHSWVKHRKERRPALTESQAEAQLSKLSKEPGNPIAAIEWIQHSIASGYQGVFAPKSFQQNQNTKTARNGVQHNGFFETDYTVGADTVPSY